MVTARDNEEGVARNALAEEANTAFHELQRAANHVQDLLDKPRMSHPSMAGERARLLSGLVAAGAVAVDREE
jgi:hypothetical protein